MGEGSIELSFLERLSHGDPVWEGMRSAAGNTCCDMRLQYYAE